MKNITTKILTIGITAVLFTGCLTACKISDNSKINANVKINGEEVINTQIGPGAGSWEVSDSNAMTDELKKYFDEAISKIDGYSHTPVLLLGTQVVAGTNYCFLCTSGIQANNAAKEMRLAYINVDPSGSATQAGITNYDDLYADIRLWIKNGWIDYVLPQLYWEIGKKVADYEVLAHWWANEVRGTKCKLYIGMAPYRLENASPKTAWGNGNEIERQMLLNRTIPEITGECFYSTRPLLRNPRGVCDAIRLIYTDDAAQKETDFLPWE